MTQYDDELLALQTAGAAIASSPDLQYTLNAVTREMLNLLSVQDCVISHWNQDEDTISLLAEQGSRSEQDLSPPAKIYSLADFPLIKQTLTERRAQQITISQAEAKPIELAY